MLRRALLVALTAGLLLPAAAHAGAVSKSGDVFTYTSTAGNDTVFVGTKQTNAGDVSPTGTDGNRYVFLDASIPSNADCVDYTYDPPTAPPLKVGVVCQGNANTTVTVSPGDGDDLVQTFTTAPCGTALPCITIMNRPFTADGGGGNDTVSGGNNVSDLRGGAGDDVITGRGAIDSLDGGAGRDTLSGGFGADDIRGGAGVDEVVYTYTNDRVIVSLDDAANDGAVVPAPIEGDNVHSDVEDITGGGGPDIFTGSALANRLQGGPGDDQLDGGGGIDAYYGQSGADTLNTRDGNSERVDCGDDADTANSDNADNKSACEVDNTSNQLEGDLDKDGIAAPVDCNDRDASIKPGGPDAPDNGIDENCDGVDATLRDRDKDGFVTPADCDDTNPAAKPGGVEIFGNAVDENCNGKADPLLSIASFVRSSFRDGAKATGIRSLRVASLRAGTTVTVFCAGRPRACSFASRTVTVTRDTRELDLRSRFKLRSGKVKGTIQVLLTRPDSLAKRTTFKFRRNKIPETTIQCANQAGTRFAACP